MKIPTRIRVGRKWYEVKRQAFKPSHQFGRWEWRSVGPGRIYIRPGGRIKHQRETFLHELTHAVLWRMGEKKLCANEEFVRRFSATLNNALHSAEYE